MRLSILVYLAGGMRSGWQDELATKVHGHPNRLSDFRFIDPRRNQIKEFAVYGPLDLHHVRAADVVVGFMEADNPSGAGLAVEVGYAKGLGKTVVILNESSDRYVKFIEATADYLAPSLDAVVEFLVRLQG